MKSHIAGIMLAGSLATAQGMENTSVNTESISPSTTSTQIQQTQKNRIASTLHQGGSMKVPFLVNAQEHEVGDLFMELVPETEYGNLQREKDAIGVILKSLVQLESRLNMGLDESKQTQLRTAMIDLGEQYRTIGWASFSRTSFENLTYDALLRIVTAINVESLQHLRATLQTLGRTPTTKSALQVRTNQKKSDVQRTNSATSESKEFASQANLSMYKSLYMAEQIYLENNPHLLSTCGEKFPKREELRRTAIILINRIISTVPTRTDEPNSAEHDLFRERLSQIRKGLYPQGEMGYVEAQKWGFEEQERRNATTKSKKI